VYVRPLLQTASTACCCRQSERLRSLSSVLFFVSSNGGSMWSTLFTISHPAINDQPRITVDLTTGHVFVVYLTTQFDNFNHRVDIVATKSTDGGHTFSWTRITSVSDEPDSDPAYYDYFTDSRIRWFLRSSAIRRLSPSSCYAWHTLRPLHGRLPTEFGNFPCRPISFDYTKYVARLMKNRKCEKKARRG
jgi:hypothetical protein